jgi:type I restriction enzyme S subunit
MSKWKEILLTDITTKIGDGLHGTPIYDNNGEYYFINGNNLSNGKILIKDETQRVSKAEFEKHSKILNDRTLLLGINGTIGNLAYYQNEMVILGKSACYINLNDEVDKRFIYYTFLSKHFQNYIEGIATGTTIPNVPLKGIREYSLKIPPLPEQAAIAEVLSSLDDKIDLLHRQNKTLEQLAETLFRQWFVVEADESWEEKKLLELGNIICGKTPSKKIHQYFVGKIPFIKIPDMHDKTFLFDTIDSLSENGADSQKNKTLPAKSICVSCIATVGLVSMNVFPSQTNQQINSIIPSKDIYRFFLYLKMKSMKDELLAMASGGTATDNLNTGNFSNIDITLPNEIVLNEFDEIVSPMFEKIYTNQTQIRTLTQLRDTLLPKLMSGEVRVGKEREDGIYE